MLDLGPGGGTYSKLFRKLYPDAEWVAIEAWAPYVKEFDLRSHYNRVIVGDARHIDYGPLGSFDICFCGDILEHMPESDARNLIDQLLNRCRLLFMSVPIGHFPQGEVGGNEFEVHVVDNYTEERIRELYPEIVDGTIGTSGRWTVGAFALTRNPHIASRISKLREAA
ncbi:MULTISPECIES: class I SAM-dependent methyltransferase [Methylobacteriaceae]|uniref:class I SAM-dependent methyltransferase n=1 Tax=Methylobacteriaceae TaxID=119045 RepID=UPI002F351BCE